MNHPKEGRAGLYPRGRPHGCWEGRGEEHSRLPPSRPPRTRSRTIQHEGKEKSAFTEVPAHSRSSRNACQLQMAPTHSGAALIPGALCGRGPLPGQTSGECCVLSPHGHVLGVSLPLLFRPNSPLLPTRRAHWLWCSPGRMCRFNIPSDGPCPPVLPTEASSYKGQVSSCVLTDIVLYEPAPICQRNRPQRTGKGTGVGIGLSINGGDHKSEICRADQTAGNSGRSSCCTLEGGQFGGVGSDPLAACTSRAKPNVHVQNVHVKNLPSQTA